jgi:hypothetical protein
MGLHSLLGVTEGIHALQAREPASFQDMLTGAVVSGDIGKVARKTDDGSFHVLSAVSPAIWTALTAVNSKHIYLSQATGNDANTGVIAASTVATTARAFALIPAVISGPVVIHVGSGSYDWSKLPKPVQLNSDARIWIICDGAGQAGDDGFSVVATDTAGASTDANQIVTSALSPALNAYQSYTIEMTSGAANGYRRHVMSNTAGASSVIIPARRFEDQAGTSSIGAAPGDTFRIVRPGAVFTNIASDATLFGGIGKGDSWAPLMLVNLAFDTGAGSVSIDGCTVYGAGIEWRGTNPPNLTDCAGSFGFWDHLNNGYALPTSTALATEKAAWFNDIGLGTSLTNLAKWRGWGWSAPDVRAYTSTYAKINKCALSLIGVFSGMSWNDSPAMIGGYFWGPQLYHSCNVAIIGRSNSGLSESSVVASYIYALNSQIIQSTGQVSLTGTVNPQLDLDNTFALFLSGVSSVTTTVATFDLAGASRLTLLGTNTISSQRSSTTGGAIQVSDGSQLNNAGGTLTVTMSGSGLNAIYARNGGTVSLSGTVSIVNGAVSILDGGRLNMTPTAMTLSGTSSMSVATSGRAKISSGTLTFSGTGGLTMSDGAEFYHSGGADVALNAGGSITMRSACKYINKDAGSTLAISGGGNLTFSDGSYFEVNDTFSYDSATNIGFTDDSTFLLNAGSLTVSGGAAVSMAGNCRFMQVGNVTITGAAIPLNCSNGSKYIQRGGTYTATATSGNGATFIRCSDGVFSGGASTVITAASAVGIAVTGGSKVWFNGAISNVTGATDAVQTGAALHTNAAIAALAADGFVNDAGGQANVVGRI